MKNYSRFLILIIVAFTLGCQKDNRGLVADFSILSPTLNQGFENKFLNESEGGTEVLWTFQNGIPATSSESNPVVEFTQIGPTQISLVVIDAQSNETDTITKTFIVYPGDGVVSYYPLDGNAKDFSLNENDGTVNGANPVTGRNGEENGAFAFDGENDFISTHKIIDDELGSGVTFSAWINLRDTTLFEHYIISNRRPYIFGEGCKERAGFEFLHYGGAEFEYHNAFGMASIRSGTINKIETNQWHHMSVTWDGVGELKIYIDGVVSNFFDIHTQYFFECGYVGSDTPFTIGGLTTPLSKVNRFFGAIDEVRIYKRPLSQEEIAVLAMR